MNAASAPLDGTVVALGERRRVAGFALAGAEVRAADSADEVRATWESLPDETALVILTAAAAAALGERVDRLDSPLTAVMPS